MIELKFVCNNTEQKLVFISMQFKRRPFCHSGAEAAGTTGEGNDGRREEQQGEGNTEMGGNV